MTDSLLDKALSKATQGSRNETGLWLACQLRDSGYTEVEAAGVMLDYTNRVHGNGTEPYTRAEAGAADYVPHISAGPIKLMAVVVTQNSRPKKVAY